VEARRPARNELGHETSKIGSPGGLWFARTSHIGEAINMMRIRNLQSCILSGAVIGALMLGAQFSSARAQDTDMGIAQPTPTPRPKMPSGPSAKMAAQLKRNPAPGPAWLQHYLPDDRYKIAGGVWKYVSTELDTYYHLPNSPLILRQPASIVIGFSSREQAEEAGYRAGPSVQTQIRQTQQRAIAASQPKPFTRPTTVTLGDGKSQVTVPAGWTHMGNGGFRMANFSMDMFFPRGASMQYTMPKPGQRYTPPKMVMLMTMTNPQGQNMEAVLQSDVFNKDSARAKGEDERSAGFLSQNPQASQFIGMWKDIEATPSSWGGVKALRIGAKKGSRNAALIGNGIIAARGSKMYIFSDTTGNPNASRQIRNSFVAR